MNLTATQHAILRSLANGQAREVRAMQRADRFTSAWRSSGARKVTLDALAAAGLITVWTDGDRMAVRVWFARITPAGHAYLAGLRAR
jgi:DNA-binding PadR family transcriptional regulator